MPGDGARRQGRVRRRPHPRRGVLRHRRDQPTTPAACRTCCRRRRISPPPCGGWASSRTRPWWSTTARACSPRRGSGGASARWATTRSFVLDGGLKKWLAEGRPVEAGWREAAHGEFKAHFRPGTGRATSPACAHALDGGAAQVVDARSAARFRGEAPEPRPGLRDGPHAGRASTLPWSGRGRRRRRRWRPAERCGRRSRRPASTSTAPIVTTCGSGISAAILALALARLGRGGRAGLRRLLGRMGRACADTPVATGADESADEAAWQGHSESTRLIRAGRPPAELLRARSGRRSRRARPCCCRQGRRALRRLAGPPTAAPAWPPTRPWPRRCASWRARGCQALPVGPGRGHRRDAGGAEGRRRGAGHRRRLQAPTRRFCDRVLSRFGVTSATIRRDATPDAVLALGGARDAADRAGVARLADLRDAGRPGHRARWPGRAASSR